jgi:hypothetical protein
MEDYPLFSTLLNQLFGIITSYNLINVPPHPDPKTGRLKPLEKEGKSNKPGHFEQSEAISLPCPCLMSRSDNKEPLGYFF